MSKIKELEATLLLKSIAGGESVIVLPRTAAAPKELIALFDPERGKKEGRCLPNRGMITYQTEHDLIKTRYQCLAGGGSLRIIYFGNHQHQDVVLDIYNGEFKLSVKGEFDQENIPACDPPVRVVASSSRPVFIVTRGKEKLIAQALSVVRTGPVQEYPIYVRPIGNDEIKTTTIPDWSIRDVNTFSPQAMQMIMDQIDPRVGKNIGLPGDNEFQQQPDLRPAIEIVQLIGQHLN